MGILLIVTGVAMTVSTVFAVSACMLSSRRAQRLAGPALQPDPYEATHLVPSREIEVP